MSVWRKLNVSTSILIFFLWLKSIYLCPSFPLNAPSVLLFNFVFNLCCILVCRYTSHTNVGTCWYSWLSWSNFCGFCHLLFNYLKQAGVFSRNSFLVFYRLFFSNNNKLQTDGKYGTSDIVSRTNQTHTELKYAVLAESDLASCTSYATMSWLHFYSVNRVYEGSIILRSLLEQ